MDIVTSFRASALPREELGAILTDYLELERAQCFRQLLVRRCGAAAVLAVLVTHFTNLIPPLAGWSTAVMFLAPPVAAWVVELRLRARLTHRLDGVPHETAALAAPDRKT